MSSEPNCWYNGPNPFSIVHHTAALLEVVQTTGIWELPVATKLLDTVTREQLGDKYAGTRS